MAKEMSLKQLMEQELDPNTQDLRARFTHAQIAVDLGYRLAEKQVYVPDTKVPNLDWKEGDSNYDKFNHVEAPAEAKTAELVKIARLLKVEIEKDLNDTLRVLEAKDDGAKADAPKLS